MPGRERDVAVARGDLDQPRHTASRSQPAAGVGLSFQVVSKPDRDAITWFVDDYLARHPAARG